MAGEPTRARGASSLASVFVLGLAALSLLLWPSGPPSLYSLWPAALGLPVPTCEPGRLLVLRDPPLRGEDVAELQTALARLGVYEGPVDGIFSPETGAAVSVARLQHGLAPVPRADTAFWTALEGEWLAGPYGETAIPVTGTEAPPEGDLLIVIDIERVRLTLFVNGFPHKSYPVAVGKSSTPSAVGQWVVRNKGIEVGPPFGSRWLGLSVPWGIYGIHGTNNPGSIGSAVSGGCIRMFNWNVEELYDWVPVGTKVYIVAPHWTASVSPSLPEGSVGLGVVFLQWQMQRLGWSPGDADARLGGATIRAVRNLEALYGLEVDGVVDRDLLCLLDLGP